MEMLLLQHIAWGLPEGTEIIRDAVSYTHLDVYKRQVHGSVKNCNCFFLRLILAPVGIFIKQIGDVAAPHGTVQRADHRNFQPGQFFHGRLHLRAVFADNVAVIAARIRNPCLLYTSRCV